MKSSQGVFSTIEASSFLHILTGNDTTIAVCGNGSVAIQDGVFNDVLYVPYLSANLLSISQITHSGSGKIIEFTADSVFIRDSAIGGLIAIGTVDHTTCLYTFLHFGPQSSPWDHNSFLAREHHAV